MPQTPDQTQFDNEMRGVLFVNAKGDNPNRPDYRGNVQVDGKGYRVSAWKRRAKQSGQTFLSMSLTRDEALDADQGDIPADNSDLF